MTSDDATDEPRTDDAARPEGGPSAGAAGAPESPKAGATFTEAEVQARIAAREAELQDRHLRLAAEYQNYRRRVEREKEAWADETLEAFGRDLLPVLDSFERALAAREKDPAAAASGIELVDRQLRGVLEKHGMTPVDASGAFDPRFHEALIRTQTDEKPAGTVLSVLEGGWKMKSRLLRPARVQVAAPKD